MANQKLLVLPSRMCLNQISRRYTASATAIGSKYKDVIGERDIVGYGANGEPIYYDNVMFPFPAIRFMKNTPSLMALREKEKGDWKKLTLGEKKQLYRASFRQTFEEMNAPTGEYKSVIGFGLIFACVAVLSHMGLTYFIYGEMPHSLSQESQEAQLRRVLDLRMNPITGISSKWDYEKDTWKSDCPRKN